MDGRMGEWTDRRQAHESDFMGHCPTDVELPIKIRRKQKLDS